MPLKCFGLSTSAYASQVIVEPADNDLLGAQVHELENVFVWLHQANQLGMAAGDGFELNTDYDRLVYC